MVAPMSTVTLDKPALTADQIVDAMKETDWQLPVVIDTDPPREIIGMKVEELEGEPAFRLVLQTRPIEQ
jgi:hypothetical protein